MTSKDLTNNFINIAIENGYATFKKKAAYKASEFTIFTVSLFKSKFGNFYLISIKVDIIGYNKFKDYELNNNLSVKEKTKMLEPSYIIQKLIEDYSNFPTFAVLEILHGF